MKRRNTFGKLHLAVNVDFHANLLNDFVMCNSNSTSKPSATLPGSSGESFGYSCRRLTIVEKSAHQR